jgi:hypothetical protein
MTAGGALITGHLVKGPLRFSPHPFGARLQAGCAPRAASGLTLDQPIEHVKPIHLLLEHLKGESRQAYATTYVRNYVIC